MSGLSEITVNGTVVVDPILRYTETGTPLATLRVAANERRRNGETGEWEDANTTFLQCVAWGQQAENTAASLSKGHRVIVSGVLKQRSWQTDDGETRQSYEVTVTELGTSLRFASARLAMTGRRSSDDEQDSARPDAGA